MTMVEPLIGITLDSEEPGGYSRLPWYALRQNYCDAIAQAGGLPLPLPHQVGLVGSYLDAIDGLVITGGAFDVDPALFGASDRHDTVKLKAGRTDFELAITKGAIARDMPILGICGGEQLLAVALGGSLIQHIPDEIEGAARDHQPVDGVEIGSDQGHLMRQGQGQAAGLGDGIAIVLAQGIPGKRRVAARVLAIQSDADDGECHGRHSR